MTYTIQDDVEQWRKRINDSVNYSYLQKVQMRDELKGEVRSLIQQEIDVPLEYLHWIDYLNGV